MSAPGTRERSRPKGRLRSAARPVRAAVDPPVTKTLETPGPGSSRATTRACSASPRRSSSRARKRRGQIVEARRALAAAGFGQIRLGLARAVRARSAQEARRFQHDDAAEARIAAVIGARDQLAGRARSLPRAARRWPWSAPARGGPRRRRREDPWLRAPARTADRREPIRPCGPARAPAPPAAPLAREARPGLLGELEGAVGGLFEARLSARERRSQ